MAEPLVTFQAAGLVTTPNDLAAPEGALLEADNISLDRDNIVTPFRGFEALNYPLPGTDARATALTFWNGRLIVLYSSVEATGVLAYYDENGTDSEEAWPTLGTGYLPPSDLGHVRFQEMGESLYFATSAGIYKIDSIENAPTLAGGLKGLDGTGTLVGTTGFFLNNTQRAYRILWIYEDATGRLVEGVPSQRIVLVNSSGGTRNVTLTFKIPTGATKLYAYQVYRSLSSAGVGDPPDDNLYLAFEENPTDPQITAGSITITDEQPDGLLGAALYTNPNVTINGIADGNEPPPLAQDLTLFKDMGLYANTTSTYRLELSLQAVVGTVGVADGTTITIAFDDNTSHRFIASPTTESNGPTVSYFKYEVGGTVSQNIADTALSLVRAINGAGKQIRAYYVSTESDFPGRISLEGQNPSSPRFYVYTTDKRRAWNPPLPLRIEPGNTNISRTSNVVTYTSYRPHELVVGQRVTLEPFAYGYTVRKTGTTITRSGGVTTLTVDPAHNFAVNQVVNFQPNGVPADPNFPAGFKRITGIFNGTQLSLEDPGANASTTVSYYVESVGENVSFPSGEKIVTSVPTDWSFTYAETGANASALNPYLARAYALDTVAGTRDTYKNGLYVSKGQQHAAVPLGQVFFVGDESEEILRVLALRDAFYPLKTDGIFRGSGTTPEDINITELDTSAKLVSPQSALVTQNTIIGLFDQGVMAVSEAGARPISRAIETELLALMETIQSEALRQKVFAVADEDDRKYYLFMPTSSTYIEYPSFAYVYNFATRTWTKRFKNVICGAMSPQGQVFLGASDSARVLKDRRSFTFRDYADEEVMGIEALAIDSEDLTRFQFNNYDFDAPGPLQVGDVVYQAPDTTWRNVTQFARVQAVDFETGWVTLDRPLELIVSSVTVLRGISCRIRWTPQTGGNPVAQKQFTEAQLHFKRMTTREVDCSFATDQSPGFETQTLEMESQEASWSQFEWGSSPWGGASEENEIGQLTIPADKQRGNMLHARLEWVAGWSWFEMQAMVVMGRPYQVQRGRK